MIRRLFALLRRPVVVNVHLDAADFDAKQVARAVRAELIRDARRNGHAFDDAELILRRRRNKGLIG